MTARDELRLEIRRGLTDTGLDAIADRSVLQSAAERAVERILSVLELLVVDGEIHRVSVSNDMGCPTDGDRLYEVWIEER